MLVTQSMQKQQMPQNKKSVIFMFKIAGVNNTVHINKCTF